MVEDMSMHMHDTEDVEDTNIKINPDFYIHNAILKAQQALLNPDFKEAHLRYSLFIEHIEMLSRAAKKIDKKYDEYIKAYMESDEYKTTPESIIKQSKLANKKLAIIMENVFDLKPMDLKKLELRNTYEVDKVLPTLPTI